MVTATLGDHLDFSNGSVAPVREAHGPFPVYGSNGVIGYTARRNASGPLIVVGRVGSYCGSTRYSETDAWVSDNALVCRAKNPEDTRFWYYALRTCRLNEHRSGSGQPLLNQGILRDVPVHAVAPRDRLPIAGVLGALDDKIAANQRVIEAAEALMVATARTVTDHVPLAALASRATAVRGPGEFEDVVAHYSLPAFDDGATPKLADAASVRSGKFVVSGSCVLFAKLNPRIPRIWNVVSLPREMALASMEFVVLRPLGVGTSALWSAVRQRRVSEVLQQRVVGTSPSRQRIQPRDLMEVPVLDVRRLSVDAARTIADLGVLCDARRGESARLSAYRDAVLPLLMSGKVRVAADQEADQRDSAPLNVMPT